VHNGFRVLSARALAMIRITHDGMAHNTEIVSKIKKHGLCFAEHPVAVTYFRYGQKVSGGFKILGDILLNKFTK
jgi:hypothetical protein